MSLPVQIAELERKFAETMPLLPHDYGDIGRGDDTATLQRTIDRAGDAGGGEVQLAARTYYLGRDLVMPDNVILKGQGWNTILKAKDGVTDTIQYMLKGVNTNGWGARNILLDGNTSGRTINFGFTAIGILGGSDCRFDNVYTRDFGKSTAQPSGAVIYVRAFERTSSGNPFPGTVLSCYRNKFTRCVFDDRDAIQNFTVRVFSDFTIDQPQEDFESENRENTFESCTAIGGAFVVFDIAGPCSVGNSFINCTVRDWKANEAFLIDKGARSNKVLGCHVNDFAGPSALTTVGQPTAYRCQGLGDIQTNNWKSTGNVFEANTCFGWGPAAEGGGSIPAAFMAHFDENTLCTGNVFNCESDSGSVAGFVIYDNVQKVSIKSNKVFGAKYGLINYSGALGADLYDWDISGNVFTVDYDGINITASDPDAFNIGRAHIENNTIYGSSNCAIALDSGTGAVQDCIVSGNKIYGAATGIRAGSTGNIIEDNKLYDITIYGISLNLNWQDGDILRNTITVSGSGLALNIADEETYTTNTRVWGNNWQYTNSNDRMARREFWAYSAPATGTYNPNDLAHNLNRVSGTPMGWVYDGNASDWLNLPILYPTGVRTLTYGVSVSTDIRLGRQFKLTITDGVGFLMDTPTAPVESAVIVFDILNSSGGAAGAINWNATSFKLAGAWTQPADTRRRTISFYYDGGYWIELSRAAADI